MNMQKNPLNYFLPSSPQQTIFWLMPVTAKHFCKCCNPELQDFNLVPLTGGGSLEREYLNFQFQEVSVSAD